MALAARRSAIQFDQHSVVNITAERAFHGLQISLVAISRKLHTVGQTAAQIVHELNGSGARAVAKLIGQDQVVSDESEPVTIRPRRAGFQAAQSWRHSASAAARLSLKFARL